MLPAQRRDMSEKIGWDGSVVSGSAADNISEFHRVPEYDDGGQQVHAGDAIMLAFARSVPDFTAPMEASALWESLAQNHPFIDGNKRAAFAVTYTFLAINNLRITADAEAIYAFISGLYEAQSFEFDHLVHWLGANTAAV